MSAWEQGPTWVDCVWGVLLALAFIAALVAGVLALGVIAEW